MRKFGLVLAALAAALLFTGDFTKAKVEEMVERLPDFTPGSCRVKLGIQPAAE